MTEAIGIDVGGTGIRAVRVDLGGEAHQVEIEAEHIRLLTPDDRSQSGMVEAITAVVGELEATRGTPIGLAIAGGVRKGDGVVTSAANFPEWHDFAVGPALSSRLQGPVRVGNDADLFTLGEVRAGAAREFASVLGLTLGTGLGGGLVFDGKLHRGHRGMAGEVGHLHCVLDGVPCGCGARGCLEQYASTLFLEREGHARGLVEPDEDRAAIGKKLAASARDGGEEARKLFEEMGRVLGEAIGGLVMCVDVEAIVVGGGLESAYDLFGPTFEATVRGRVFAAVADDLHFVRASRGSLSGALGAAFFAVEV